MQSPKSSEAVLAGPEPRLSSAVSCPPRAPGHLALLFWVHGGEESRWQENHEASLEPVSQIRACFPCFRAVCPSFNKGVSYLSLERGAGASKG